MNANDVELVRAWRNHPEIRKYMLKQHEISHDEHRRWFERTSKDPARKLLIVQEREMALGFVHFSGVVRGGVADWGFYAAPDAPRGAGRKLGMAALNYAFQIQELHKVCGQALDFNEASIRLHHMLGFQREGVLRDQCRIGNTYHGLICFGLLRREWSAKVSNE